MLATAGDPFLGGDDFDLVVADVMADAFLVQHRFDPRADPQAFERLRQAAEQLKKQLSLSEVAGAPARESPSAWVAAPQSPFGLTRSELEKMAAPLIERTLRVTEDALNLARLAPSDSTGRSWSAARRASRSCAGGRGSSARRRCTA